MRLMRKSRKIRKLEEKVQFLKQKGIELINKFLESNVIVDFSYFDAFLGNQIDEKLKKKLKLTTKEYWEKGFKIGKEDWRAF